MEDHLRAINYYWNLSDETETFTAEEAKEKLLFLKALPNSLLSRMGVQDMALCYEVNEISKRGDILGEWPFQHRQVLAQEAYARYLSASSEMSSSLFPRAKARLERLAAQAGAVRREEAKRKEEQERHDKEDRILLDGIRTAVNLFKSQSKDSELFAYKYVTDSFLSPMFGTKLRYTPKTYVTVDAWDADFNVQCGAGIHVAALNWARLFAGREGKCKVIKVSFLASDVVGFPQDADKLRVKKVFVEDVVE